MNDLVARFEKRFRGGATIAADLAHPADGFSVLVLFGPSGSGKTTILRALAGLEKPETGSIRFGHETWFDAAKRVHLPPQRRGIGYLFQQYALFPHLTVAQNVAYGIRLPKGVRTRVDPTWVSKLLERFDLGGLEDRFPSQLSGGQQQRVALARTLACEPRLLLLDEPLSSLDQTLREQVRGELRGWLAEFALPAILVTHDRIDAMALGDHVAILSEGRVVQHGPLQQVFSNPLNENVARIVGVETIVEGQVVERDGELVCLQVEGARIWGLATSPVATRGVACIRGEDVAFSRQAQGESTVRNRLPGRIVALSPEGPLVRVTIDCGFRLTSLVTKPASTELGLRVGDTGLAFIKATAIHVIAH
jgi:molybdate transport system ATP-binding protein